jgi:DNA-binding LytR/AlgR family response regulator
MPKILLISKDLAFNQPAILPQPQHVVFDNNILSVVDNCKPDLILLEPQLFLDLLQDKFSTVLDNNFIVTKTRAGLKKVAFEHIQYFCADHKYVLVYYNDGELLLNETLNNLAVKYAHWVLRIHRNTLVNTMWIDELINDNGKHFVTIKGHQTRLSISRRQLPAVRKYMRCGKLE